MAFCEYNNCFIFKNILLTLFFKKRRLYALRLNMRFLWSKKSVKKYLNTQNFLSNPYKKNIIYGIRLFKLVGNYLK